MSLKFRMAVVLAASTLCTSSFAATRSKTKDQGNVATINLLRTAAITCADGSLGEETTNAIFVARENVTRADGVQTATRALDLAITIFETCNQTTQSASGLIEDLFTYTQTKTTSATVQGEIPLFHVDTGAPFGTANISLNFTGGASSKSVTYSKFIAPGLTIIFRSVGVFADATVTGEITVNGANLLAGTEDVTADLGTLTSGQKSIVQN